ncbi:YbaY family lipoprotein [Metapseudomonas otitidis]|jgi:putative lipoprotein|uniref:Uncharacterized protein n=1 Tax=Metapseudomonas otitidis TaxID=319939 RepID=A0A1I0TQI1_9GAMM|nr:MULTISPECIES: YbaY family lipoprotein [Pseudomonas]KIV61689.1 glycoprotein/polysaccharide metabolism [Pseudomonas sp. FeS53a]MBO2927776.1 YbaY family lipoprotein [Pseudomonas otitidis]MCP1618020.1 putative lipoprotein [Pseudomonas otitidis]MDH0334881.1 YbaY family lipoprotein [Pseudomonas otitidis]MDU9397389.1 YbaY family lipoprotein [Pseudomonas sp. zfem003]
MKRTLPLLFASLLLGACTTPQTASMAQLEGEVYYLQRMALPPDATLRVTLVDVSLADAPARELAHQQGRIEGQVPLAFQLSYDPANLQSGHQYAVAARIELDGKLMFISSERHSVKLDGTDPQPLRIRVDPVR